MEILKRIPEDWAKTIRNEEQIAWRCAFLILNDECPPDNKFYFCTMGEEPECDCRFCWDNYIWYLKDGFNPYQRHLKEED